MKQFEQPKQFTEEINAEYSPETIAYLRLKREKFYYFLNDYINDIPKEELHGELEKKYKCQKNWFSFLMAIEIINKKLEEDGKQNDKIAKLVKKGNKLVYELNNSRLTTKEQIDTGDEILKSAIEELDKIIGE